MVAASTWFEAIVGLALPSAHDDAASARALDVLFAGSRPPDPADLLQSRRMADFMRQVEEEYDGLTVGGASDAASIVNTHSTLIRISPPA